MSEVPPSEKVYITGLPDNGMDEATLRKIFNAYGTLKEVKHIASAKACFLTFASLGEAKWVVENLDGNMPEGISVCLKVKYSPTGRGGPDAPKLPGGGWNTGASGGGGGGGGWNTRPGPYDGGKGGGWGGKGGPVVGGGGSIAMLKQMLKASGRLPGFQGTVPLQNQLYIRGLPSDTADGDLHELFAPFGAIPPKGVKAMMNEDGTCRGIGFVDYLDEADAHKAMQAMNGAYLMDGTQLQVHVKNSTKKTTDAAKK